MNELTNGVSWLGVIAGAAVSFLVGWLWYSEKVFGRKWAEGARIPLDTAAAMPVGALVSQALGLFLMSWFVGVTAVSNALLTVILATAAFAVLAYSGGMFSQKSAYTRNVEAGYLIVSLIIMVICQGIF
jgi:high-affinity Fe2+/Pb2+ permease